MKIKFRIIAALLAVLIVLPISYGFAIDEEYINVALYKPITASGEIEDHSADLAIDNLNTNKYHTYWDSGESESSSWLQLDLGVNYLIDRLELETPGGASSFGGFEVRASKTEDFYNYEVLAKCTDSFSGSIWQVNLEPKDSYRYVQIIRNSGGMQIGEFRVLVKNTSISEGMFEATAEILELMPFAEDGRYIVFSDITGTGYNEPVSFLSAFQIMRGYTNGKFMPEEKITRAEFVATIIRALGDKVVATDGTRYYGDVPTDFWAASAINSATAMDLIHGKGDGTFAPNDEITGEQALKIVCHALGYKPLAEYRGGFPDGYIDVASELKLTNHIKSGLSNAITRGEVAWLIYEALHTDVLQQTIYSDNAFLAQVTKGENLLKINHNVVSAEGRVVATDHTSLTDANAALKEGYMKINSVTYRKGSQDADEFLGITVKYYYQTDDDEAVDKVVYMIPERGIEIIKVGSESINDYNEFSREFTWLDEKDDLKKITILSTADVIYNDKAINSYGKTEIVPSAGTVTLYDLDGDDSTAELVKISSERIAVIKAVNIKDEEIYLEESNVPVSFDLKTDDCLFIDSETDAKIDLSALKSGDVINIIESSSEGNKVVKVYVTRSFVRGTAEVLTKDEIVIKGKSYKLAYNLTDVTVGSKGIFYFERNGKIAAFDGSAMDDAKYGYLVAVDESDGIDELIKAKIYTNEGDFAEFIVDEDTLLDGVAIQNFEDFKINLAVSGRLTGQVHQAIKYCANSKDELLYIDTIQQGAGYYNDFTKDAEAGSRFIKQSIFDCEFTLDEKVTVLKVPDDMSRTKDFAVLSSAFFEQGSSYEIEAYDGGEEKAMKLVLLTSASANQFKNDSEILLVDEVEQSYVDGETTKVLKALRKGKAVEYLPYDDGVFDGLKKGDIIQITVANEKYVVMTRKLFYSSMEGLPEKFAVCPQKPVYTVGSMVANFYIGYGKATTNKDGFVRVMYEDLSNLDVTNSDLKANVGVLINTKASDLEIYVYDKELDRVYVGTPEDIKSADMVGDSDATRMFIYLGAVAAKAVVVFK